MTRTDLGLETIVLFVSDLAASRAFYGHALGLRPLAAGPHAATYSAGHVQLCLLPAAEHGVALQEGLDRSADITFMVGDFPRCRDALAARGVRFSRTLEYSIGMTADFFDPDGHWFSLYQPSEAALGWPSGPKLQALASGLPTRDPGGVPRAGAAGDDLADAFIAYVFLFFSDPEAPASFYGDVLGFDVVEGGPCRRVPGGVESGVVKYDVGTTMLTTHHVASDDRRFRVATAGTDGVAMAFRVAHLATAVDALSRRGIAFSGGPSGSPVGRLARFTDPAGHVLLLREPAPRGARSVRAGAFATRAAGS
ncbi:MAG TPA: VOC family protein [Longimicrobium sp.]|nr:VOC family protein [Longimicrobium sp.]